jgi:hypothetical protein
VAERDHRAPLEATRPADDRGVVRVRAIAPQLDEVRRDLAEVVERVRAIGMLGELDLFPRIGMWSSGLTTPFSSAIAAVASLKVEPGG